MYRPTLWGARRPITHARIQGLKHNKTEITKNTQDIMHHRPNLPPDESQLTQSSSTYES